MEFFVELISFLFDVFVGVLKASIIIVPAVIVLSYLYFVIFIQK